MGDTASEVSPGFTTATILSLSQTIQMPSEHHFCSQWNNTTVLPGIQGPEDERQIYVILHSFIGSASSLTVPGQHA